MSEVKRGLGRGLSALLGDPQREQLTPPEQRTDGGIRTINVGAIRPNPDQPRRHFDESALNELAASIKARGLLQPIIVRTIDGGYQIVAGERRWRAAQRAQLHEIPAIVRSMNDAETFELAIIENVQRQDLNAIEEAEAYQRLGADYGHTQEVLGKLVGKSRSHIANLLRLLDLPAEVRLALADGRLSMGHARALITAADPAGLADQVIRQGLSVRETERLAKQAKGGKEKRLGPIEYKGSNTDTEALERQLGDLLGLKVAIAHGPKGGTVTISYSTLDQLDLICQRLSGGPI
ncbi:ParB/RepB/Spo0J family partition protein [Sphingomonas sp. BIUV-7]|uniref:ParB/RepB/Spo0J family partition protein n=1 Tax=Sphingomonas natans TaxID=3063330 RepID=A0ABT8YCE2_9SPHN|nr:ParB/RepB/Spo0J family partition protein [Sphingomonas sp. BIUV-7]MDO6416011.1 ParB/RepB/Spo0J family partition protein [Sphingomonas sp. BIUV-7]